MINFLSRLVTMLEVSEDTASLEDHRVPIRLLGDLSQRADVPMPHVRERRISILAPGGARHTATTSYSISKKLHMLTSQGQKKYRWSYSFRTAWRFHPSGTQLGRKFSNSIRSRR